MTRFHATNKPGTCLWCGKTLAKGVGPYNDGFFCTLTCGHSFAVDAAKNGYRFKPSNEPPPPKKKRGIFSPRCPLCKRSMEHIEIAYQDRWWCYNHKCEQYTTHRDYFEWTDKTDRDAVVKRD